ncbi:MAG: BON domain-containing protein [Reyranella sp.]|nr:BON domain-containing protein [Reyranella sp.]
MARHDQNRDDIRDAYGRYSGSEQGDDRRRAEKRGHGLYGYPSDQAPGYEHEYAYYDPHQLYRGRDGYGRREYFRHEGDQPYGNRPYPGDYGRHEHDGIRERDREAWRHPSSWFGGEQHDREREHLPEEHGTSHRGHGPKGYLRSDDRIREDVCDRLTDDPHIDASEVEVAVKNGEVTLGGTIESRAARRHAEELTEDLSGVKHVQNNLRVGQRASDGSATPLFTRTGSDKR